MGIPWLAPLGLVMMILSGVAAGLPYSIITVVGLLFIFMGTNIKGQTP
jgi:hypothetical protein